MRLKSITLQGFKTFAPRTDLVFGEGLTAIVGPNGSGKSNIADAVRWALGEQSLSNLRAKKTEDLIFLGSAKRAPLGMAEVSITLDNSDRLLSLDFSEVTITRRAYRSGENEYYINKSRVRLRDVLGIASTLGQAYTVVGQGLVDAALSLRAEERRELFEEAATIRGYFVQREDALRKLARTSENITRINDLVVELEPQVRRMERQARSAQEYGKVDEDLRAALRTWYMLRWHGAVDELHAGQQAEEAAHEAVEARKAEMSGISAQLSEARAAVWAHVDATSALQEERTQLRARHAEESQRQAIVRERIAAARQQRESLLREHDNLEILSASVQSQLEQLEADEAGHAAEMASLQEAGEETASRLAELEALIARLESERTERARELDALLKRQSALSNRLLDAQRRSAEHQKDRAQAEADLASLQEKLSSEEAALAELRKVATQAGADMSQAELEQSFAREALAEARTAQASAEANRREAVKRADALASQLTALAGEQQAGLYAGVRVVVSAASAGKLKGYVGTVAELLRVPAHLETAVEAALGGRLQEMVMSGWEDVERAIGWLKQEGAGRATFLPLDTLKASPAPNPPQGEGIVGLAHDLVEYDASFRTLAEAVLGRLLIVEDLPTARRTLSKMAHNAPWTLATLGGEVVRSGGAVTGGSDVRAGDTKKGRSILARERKRRELLAEQESAQRELKEAERAVDEALASVRELEARLSAASARAEDTRKRHVNAQLQHVEQQGSVSRLHKELEWRGSLMSEAHKNIEHLASLVEGLSAERDELESQIAPLRQALGEMEEQLEKLQAGRAGLAQASSASDTRMAVIAEALRNVRARRGELREEAARIERRKSELQGRIEEIAADEGSLEGQLEAHGREVERLAAELAEIEVRLAPTERQLKELEAEATRIEREQAALQAALLESETTHSQAAVERQRCAGVLDSLRVEITEELGGAHAILVEPVAAGVAESSAGGGAGGWGAAWAESGNGTVEPDLLLNGAASNGNGYAALALSQPERAEVERRVYALKAKLSRLGPVNPLAVEEHAALAERHAFLKTQLADLLKAAESLKHVISELDRTMHEQFVATFAQVNEAFQDLFRTLFGGGTARLELTNPDDLSASGVEISAQPPGKRMQPLAALSGGERALTAVALLFALLRVRPVPFCVLDEVDAALDESNVARFRSALQGLGKQTQFVIVTHNRGTIEAADTLYGVSMGDDGVSQMLSLKVEA